MQPARFRQADFSLVKINNAKSISPVMSSGRSAGSFPEQQLVIEPTPVPIALILVLFATITVIFFKEHSFFSCNLDTLTMIPYVATITADHEPESNN